MTQSNLPVTSLSQYIKIANCDRFLRFRLNEAEAKAMQDKWDITIQPLTPLLREEGFAFERRVEDALIARGEPIIRFDRKDPTDKVIAALKTAATPTILLQPPIEGTMGATSYRGLADVIHVTPAGPATVDIYIADIKASRHERMEHRLQVAAYAYLLRQMTAAAHLTIRNIAGGVLHIQEDGTLPQLDTTQTFDLDTYLTILHHVAINDDSVVNRVAAADFADVFYHLGYRCDGCMYNALCMYDSAERKDLSLVPSITATEKRTLQQRGITTVDQLADLMDLPTTNGDKQLTPNPAHAATVQELANTWPIAVNLPTLVQRAKRAARRFDPNRDSKTYLLDGGYGTLPADDSHPGLIKIFFDAQHDYLKDRIYLLSALVSTPTGQQTIVESTAGPPTDDAERALLITWVTRILAAVAALTNDTNTFIHLYCYNPYDQRVLLDALKRHLNEVALLPGFFDLLTQSPALNQPIISFLARELEDRRNLGTVCAPLHDTARQLGFDWTDQDGRAFFDLFRARLFDNRRDVVRSWDGAIAHAPTDVPRGDPRRTTIESASRFNSQIPLEYAYATWDALPDDAEDARERTLLRQFHQVTSADLTAFAAHRVRALAHIENSFTYKNRYTGKEPMNLTALLRGDAATASLAQSLKEFLFMEHHASLQAKLQTYALPIDRRIQTGLAALLQYDRYDPDTNHHHFTIPFEILGLDPVLTMNALRLKEGAWVVFNSAEDTRSANQMKHGRLAIIQSVGDKWLDLEFRDFFTPKTYLFRYYHDSRIQPEPGHLYTIDEMADDMNADKHLEALANTDTNTLYAWLRNPPHPRPQNPTDETQAAALIDVIHARAPKSKLTKPQRDVVADRLSDPILLVQGPPGTGKSHTIGWAVINRLLIAAAAGRPCRIAVACKTHNAVNIVLESIAKKLTELNATGLRTVGRAPIQPITVNKLTGDNGENLPAHVHSLNPYAAGKTHLDQYLAQPYLIVGGTPGGLYNLAKKRSAGGNKVDWDLKAFDLLVIDEASQMNVPEALLAAAFLTAEGSILIVGDHRQMPPIIAHDWDTEELRSAVAHQPYKSLFEYLLDLGFPRASLDRSFRLHRTIADFLQENIYVHDGIRFYSNRTDLLTPVPHADPFVAAVMDPNHPIVVIEHGEQTSHQFNQTELAIVTPLIDAALTMRMDGADGIGVVVPHRAQKALLRQKFPTLAAQDAIDTVERFQGGERDIIIVSATASDPDYVLAEADFLLNLNRLNVALSRPRKKLIVVASRTVTQLLVSDLNTFDNAVIWKRLYYTSDLNLLWGGNIGGTPLTVRGRYDA